MAGGSSHGLAHSDVNRPAVDGECRLLQRLAEGRVGVAGARNVLGRGAEFLGEDGFGDQGTGIGADDVHTEHPVRRAIGKDFDKAFGVAVRPGARIGGERELDRKSTRLNSSHEIPSRMPSSA